MGNYPEYVILAKNKDQIKAGVDFARSHGIRLVIRNTGHDFQSRSAGAGSLAINTHGLQDISFTDKYEGPGDYRGPAVTAGAGVQGFELLAAAYARDPKQTVVTGECGVSAAFPHQCQKPQLTENRPWASPAASSRAVATDLSPASTASPPTVPYLSRSSTASATS